MALRSLEIRELHCSYGFEGERELAPFPPQTFTLQPGEITTVEGDNGSGKTSLLRTILGQVPQADGMVKITRDDGSATLDVRHLFDAGIRIFYIPQRVYNLFPVENCVETAARTWGNIGGRYRSADQRQALYKELGLARFIDLIRYRRCENLTGGESQVFAIVLGFLCRPDLILLDEPTAALSQQNKPKVRELIRKLVKPSDGFHVFSLVVTHDKELSEEAAQHVKLGAVGIPI